MFWQPTLTAAALLGAQAVLAGIENMYTTDRMLVGRAGVGNGMADLTSRMAAEAGALSEVQHLARDSLPRVSFEKRADATTAEGVTLNSDGTINMTAWDNLVNTACTQALSKLPESTNPSGTCTCYNLPVLNNKTGAFEADLRLYQLSTPRGEFAGISASNIQVGLSYTGASVSPVTNTTAASKVISARQNTNGLRLLQTYLFVGQIKEEALTGSLTMAQLEALVMPVVSLTATNSTGQTVSTNVSSNEASFVAGVFSQETVMSSTALAQAAVDDIVNALHNNTVAFVLPGVQLMLFPIGLIITSIWLVVGLGFIGFGTYERMMYAQQFKTRSMLASKPVSGRI